METAKIRDGAYGNFVTGMGRRDTDKTENTRSRNVPNRKRAQNSVQRLLRAKTFTRLNNLSSNRKNSCNSSKTSKCSF